MLFGKTITKELMAQHGIRRMLDITLLIMKLKEQMLSLLCNGSHLMTLELH